jgi:cytoskeletal protein CcmA (bactofilin family)
MKFKNFKEETPQRGDTHTLLAVGTTIKGDIITDGDIRLNGRVEGDITCSAKIVIGEKGEIYGNIVSVNAEIQGKVVGDIKTSSTLILKASSVITGDILALILEIEPKAQFNGICKIVSAEDSNA